MTRHSKKWFGVSPMFDPAVGETVVEPPGAGIGYWAGAPSAVYDDATGSFFLYYRERKPLDQGRGWRCHVARGDDGVRFSLIWTATKEELNLRVYRAGSAHQGSGRALPPLRQLRRPGRPPVEDRAD